MSAEQQEPSQNGPDLACSRTNGNWNPETVTGGLLAFHEPCSLPECFPDNEATPDERETASREESEKSLDEIIDSFAADT